MPDKLPNLSGVASKDLVETIGSGSFKASYINWSRTMQLLRDHAPGWMIEIEYNQEGGVLHRDPVGAKLMLRFRHLDGTVTTSVPQAVMDNRNNSIPFDKITSRDVTDTHRRGACLASAMLFGLAYELWAKMPLENGYTVADEATIEKARQEAAKPAAKVAKATKAEAPAATTETSRVEFVALATSMGLCDEAITELSKKVKDNYDMGIKTLQSKDATFVASMNEKFLASQY